ncbi:DNA-binding protein [Pyronema omphalodes]|nr:DNA-binding protein [Pyronema omphalodes]
MVQTFLGASIGSLVYLRGLFPDQCFAKMLYTHELAEDYSKFCSAPEVDPRHPGTKFTRLQKGVSKKVDSFLTLLEGGVFKAIKDKYLKAMQVYITSEKDNVDTVIESYTFTFAYLENGVSLSLGGHEVTVGNASQSAENLTRRLLTITEDLSILPNHIWLSIQLHYTDDTPNGYTVPGFNRLGIGAPNLVMQGEAVRRWACGRMDSGFHGYAA